MKTIASLTCLILSITACSIFQTDDNTSETIGDIGQERTVSGIVLEVISDCAFDAICAYVVETESGAEITVIWAEGDSPDCANNPFSSNSALDVFATENMMIEAFGMIVDEYSISVCGDDTYTISFLEDSMSNEDATQATRQITGNVVEVISDCAFDGICAYVVESDSGERVTVIWAEGMSPICQNDPFQGGDTDIQVGDSIDSLGRVIDADTTSACGDPSYYIRKTN